MGKKHILALILSWITLVLHAQTTPTGMSGNWEVLFQDEFNGSTLDQTKWNYNYPNFFPDGGHTHNHRAYVDQSMVKVENGSLVLTAIKQRHPNAPEGTNQWADQFGYLSFDYTSGAVTTLNKFTMTEGFIEGRFKASSALGTWPAFWALNSDGGWPPEIDILEIPKERNVHHFYYHYRDGANNRSFGGTQTGADKSQGYHVYGVDWGSNYMNFYYDGQLVRSFTNQSTVAQARNMYLLINLAVGGWAGDPPASAAFPSSYYCDWVRVWKRKPVLLSNTGLETGSLSPWSTWNTGVTNTCAYAGANGLRINSVPGSSEQVVTLKANTTYIFGGYAKVANSGEQALFGVKDYGGSQLTTVLASTLFKKDSVIFKTGASNTSATVFFYKNTGTGAACADNFFLYEVTCTAPKVTLTSPSNNTVFSSGASIPVQVSTSACLSPISKVEYYLDNVYVGERTQAPYAYTLTNVSVGEHALYAKIIEQGGTTANATAISFVVGTLPLLVNGRLETGALTPWTSWNTTVTSNCLYAGTYGLTINAAPGGSEQTVTLKANTTYIFGGHAKVSTNGELAMFGVKNYGGTQLTKLIGTTSFTRDSLSFTTGTTNTSAVVFFYKDGGTGTACADNMFLYELPAVNAAPTVMMSSPLNNTSFNAPASVTIAATASDSDGSIAKVEFYQGTTLLSSDDTAPYSHAWTNVGVGSYALTAKAYDNRGAVTTSSSVSVSVVAVATCNTGTGVKQAGTVIGTAGSWNNAGDTKEKVFDGNTATFFDAPSTTGFVGMDLGTGKQLTGIRFHPRIAYASRMLGGKFQASNDANFATGVVDLHTIAATPTEAYQCIAITNASTFRYVRYVGPANSYTNLAEMEVYGIAVTTDPCASIAQYAENAGYVAGSKVKNGNNIYECKPWPYAGWCNGSGWAYTPGTGTYWTDAWKLIGPCSAPDVTTAPELEAK
jgi:beta-glucanase (GH16 family)